MPTYDFECPDCGHKFEQMQSISAKPLKKCPKCAKRRVRRLIGTGAGLIFKGSGFYLTDYARKGGETKTEAGEAKTETKPAETKSAEAKPTEAKPAESKKPAAKPAKSSK